MSGEGFAFNIWHIERYYPWDMTGVSHVSDGFCYHIWSVRDRR